jgi:hypothetical protein
MRSVAAAIAALMISWGLLGADRADAQVWGTLDLGGASVRYDDSVRITATTLTPRIRLEDGPLAATMDGTISALTGGGWTAQGAVDFSVLSATLGPARLEIGAEAGGSLHDDATRTGEYLGRARLHLGRQAAGVWGGVAAG